MSNFDTIFPLIYTGYMPSEAAQKFLESFNRPIIEALESEGITMQRLAKQLSEELSAYETKFFQFQGYVIDQRDVIAWDIRQKARIDAHKLRGDYPAEEVNHQGGIDITLRDCVREAADDSVD